MNYIMLSTIMMSLLSLYYALCPCANKDTNFSITTVIMDKCVCSYMYPNGYNMVKVNYTSKTNMTQYFYQNYTMIDNCPVGLYCNKKIALNPTLPLYTNMSRAMSSNDDDFISTYNLDFSHEDNYMMNSTCVNPPELNVDSDMQDGIINSNCTYEYTLHTPDIITLDMKFNESIKLNIFSYDKNIFNETNDTFNTNLTTYSELIFITISSNNSDVHILSFNIMPVGIN